MFTPRELQLERGWPGLIEGETVIQLHGTGPFEINYVNAADDPRKK